jgi:hypothetical protein
MIIGTNTKQKIATKYNLVQVYQHLREIFSVHHIHTVPLYLYDWGKPVVIKISGTKTPLKNLTNSDKSFSPKITLIRGTTRGKI